MVKLTPDLIYQAMQYINPVRDRELDLRGYKIPVIENMGATLDQFDCIDFSDNDIRKLDGFPLLKRLKWLLLNNNRIVRISEGLEKSLPSLETLVLTGNQIQELADLDPLASIKSLRTLSLLHNPVTTRQHYRAYVIFRIPHLRILDFRKIKMKEREDAAALFKSKKGKELQKEIAKKAKNAFQNSAAAGSSEEQKPTGPTAEELWKIREAISKASSLEEVERLNRLLQAGQIPGRAHPPGVSQMDEEMEEEESSHNRPMMNGN
ncbi:U2 small nuclear ribonucleoprotein A'-like [Schistocerca gregaria]|uniref:U2 small nuclear ribonucleoprotein A'-like n=1 Tax=Schistocerca gregaria TaxID=7010 RepID=UPI00211DE5C0|nr:U2 small nuclear ribonucleoprotein A'-like [Schistocerca gregaria]